MTLTHEAVFHSRSISKKCNTDESTKKHPTLSNAQAKRLGQNDKREYNQGNAKNMGNVGSTYQKVNHAWFWIFSSGWFSKYNHINVKSVIKGKAATKAPNLSLRLASSDTTTTIAAVNKYFTVKYIMLAPVCYHHNAMVTQVHCAL